MRSKLFLVIMLSLAVLLAACSATGDQAQPAGSDANNQGSAQGTPGARPGRSQGNTQGNPGNGQGNPGGPAGGLGNTLEARLAAGTLALEGTPQAVSAAQAKALLPLWQKVKTLEGDANTQAADLQAAYQQVEAAMTAEQIKAIQAMSLGGPELQTLMQTYGIQGLQGGPGGAPPNGAPGAAGTPGAERPNRSAQQLPQNPAGTPMPPAANGTPPAGFRGGRGFGFNGLFVDPVIQLLEKKAGI